MVKRKTLIVIILIALSIASALYVFSSYYLKPQSILKVGIPSEIRTLNELNVLNNIEMFITDLIYDPLTEPDPTTLEPRGYLAESWVWDPSRESCTVHLKTNVRWHDGIPFTADDVKFWYDVQKEFKIPKFYPGLAYIKNIEVLDDHTVKFILTEAWGTVPFGDLIFPKHVWEPIVEEARTKNDSLKYLLDYPNTHPIGTGPYEFVEIVAGSHVKLNRNPYFYREKIHIDGIHFLMFKSLDDAVLAMKNGQIDYIAKPLEPKHVTLLDNCPNVEIIKSPSKELHYMAFNLEKEPFNDINFRKAVAYLVDRVSLATDLLNYTGQPLYSTVPSSFVYWHNPNVTTYNLPTRAERLQKARDILMNANYTWNNGILIMPNRNPVPSFDLLTPSAEYESIRANAGIRIASWLNEIGIQASTKQLPLVNLTLKAISHDFDMYISGWELPLGPYYLYHMFHSSNAIVGGFNTIGYCSPKFDTLIEREEREPDTETRRNLIFQAQEILANDLPMIPLYERDMHEAACCDRFEGWVSMLGGIMNTWSFTYIYPVEKT